MAKRRRTRRHRKRRKNFQRDYPDDVLQTCPEDEPLLLNVSTDPTPRLAEPRSVTPVPNTTSIDKANLLNVSSPARSCRTSVVASPLASDRKRRSVSRERTLTYSGLPLLFNLNDNIEGFLNDVQLCQSSSFIEQAEPRIKAKPQPSKKTPRQCDGNIITETPRISHEGLLEFNYEIKPPSESPFTGYVTPLKRVKLNNNREVYNLEDTAERIQDLNCLHNEGSACQALNCSRILNTNSLRRLQNFNEIILNTSQSVDYDNCELICESEKIELVPDAVEEPNEISVTENSFFTPQLYSGKSASTPVVQHLADVDKYQMLSNKIEEIQEKTFASTATQYKSNLNHVGVQTSFSVPLYPKTYSLKCKRFPVRRKSTYRNERMRQETMFRPIYRVAAEQTNNVDTIAKIETFARLFAEIKRYHSEYSSKLPGKIVEICTWLGIAIKKGVTSLYKLYFQQMPLNISKDTLNEGTKCDKCNWCMTHISGLRATIEQISGELVQMQEDNKDKSEKLALLHSELDQLHRELAQFVEIKKDMHEIKEKLAAKPLLVLPSLPPPPPPPLPPTLCQSNVALLSFNKPAKTIVKKKSNETTRPIISLDDILKVKLRKISERPSPLRRSTEPLVADALRQVKLRPTSSRPQTPLITNSSASSLSNSPCSSLTRILTNVDTNVCRVKRLKRPGAYNFDDISRKMRRERDSCDYSSTPVIRT